jgi:ATP synthase in type III secretion protein N
VRSILDGHIMLSRKLAAANQYPAIDVLASVSRVMPNIATAQHAQAAATLRALMAKYQELELLIQIGEYKQGADPLADRAVRLWPSIRQFLAQAPAVHESFDKTLSTLNQLVSAK